MTQELLTNKYFWYFILIVGAIIVIWIFIATSDWRKRRRWERLPEEEELVEIVGKRTNGFRKEDVRENYISFIDEEGEKQEFTADTEIYPFIKTGKIGIIYKGTHIIDTNEFLYQERAQGKVDDFKNGSQEFSVEEVLKLEKNRSAKDFTGVYILTNIESGKSYVGQATRVLQRLRQHFTGKGGNPNVYHDYRMGDKFSVKVIVLSDTKYFNLDDLERDTIAAYNAYTEGYNETQGNG